MNNPVKKLEIISTQRSHGGILFHVVKGSENLNICLRGQPKENSPFGVIRCGFYKGKWDIEDTYTSGDILNSSRFDVVTEMSGSVLLCLFSKTEGYFEIPIKNGKFSSSDNMGRLNEGRHYKFYDEAALRTPKDITEVWLLDIEQEGKTKFKPLTLKDRAKIAQDELNEKEKNIGAYIERMDGTREILNLVDVGGCKPMLNPNHPYNEVHVYYADNIKRIEITNNAKIVSLHGNFCSEWFHTDERILRKSHKALETYGEETIDIVLSNSVEEVKLWGIGNINILKIPKNIKKLKIDYCDICHLEFHKDCKLDEINFNCTLLGRHYTNKKNGAWPEVKKFMSFSTFFYDEFEFPDAETTLYGNNFVTRKRKDKGDLFKGHQIGMREGCYEVGSANGFYYGFGHKFNDKELIQFCSETGFTDVLDFFGLKPIYPIKKFKYIEKNKYFKNFLCDKQIYDDVEEKWMPTPYKTLECFDGNPVLKDNFWFTVRQCMSTEGTYMYVYLDRETNTFKNAEHDKVNYQPLTKERYEHLLKTLEAYYGPKWLEKTEPGDLTAGEGLFAGLLLTETDQKFAEIKKVKIENLDWTLLPDRCNVLTMTKNGCWWGNENERGLRAEGGSWKTYGGTGNRWVNICCDINIEIEPVEDWKKMYKRPEKYKVTPKPKKKDFSLCPFSGSGNNPEKRRSICSRTEDGSIGDCSTCRVAAEWEEVYG